MKRNKTALVTSNIITIVSEEKFIIFLIILTKSYRYCFSSWQGIKLNFHFGQDKMLCQCFHALTPCLCEAQASPSLLRR